MARRILEQICRDKEGIVFPPLGTPKHMKVIKEVNLHKTFRGVFSLQFNYDGERLAVGFGSGGIQLYESSTGKLLKELRSCRQGGNSVMALRYHPKETHILYAGTTAGEIYVINTETGEQLAAIEEPGNEINTLDFCVDGFNFATGGRDLGIRVYETKSNKITQNYKGGGSGTASIALGGQNSITDNTMRVFAIKFHPDNQYIFVSGGWDNHIKVWDSRANDGIKRNIRGPHICGEALDMKANDILSGQWTALHALQEYNYTTGKVTRELNYPHSDGAFLYAAQYCNDDLVVAGGSGTRKLELVQISTNKSVGTFELGNSIQSIDSSKNGRIIAVGGAQDSFFILAVSD